MRGLWGLLLFAWTGSGGDIAVSAAAERLAPAWSWSSGGARIEWATIQTARNGADVEERVVLATAGRVHVLDARTGRELLEPPLAAMPGVHAVGAEGGGTFYCFDRSHAYRLELDPPRMRWKIGAGRAGVLTTAPAGREEAPVYQGDPEFLPGLLAAAVCPDGLIVLSREGRLAVLAADDGTVRWEQRIAAPGAAELRRAGDSLALLWRAEGESRLGWLDCETGRWGSEPRALGDGWPTHVLPAGDSLMLIYPRRVVRAPATGAPALVTETEALILGAAIASPELLCIGMTDGRVRTYDAAGRTQWSFKSDDETYFRRLTASGDVLAVEGEREVLAVDLRDGRRLVRAKTPADMDLLGARLYPGRLFVVWQAREAGDSEELAVFPLRQDIEADAEAGRSTDEPAIAEVVELRADSATTRTERERVFSVSWGSDGLILAGRTMLWFYPLAK